MQPLVKLTDAFCSAFGKAISGFVATAVAMSSGNERCIFFVGWFSSKSFLRGVFWLCLVWVVALQYVTFCTDDKRHTNAHRYLEKTCSCLVCNPMPWMYRFARVVEIVNLYEGIYLDEAVQNSCY